MSQSFDRDQHGSHPRPDGNDGAEQRLNQEEVLQDSKTDPRIVSMACRLQDRSTRTALLGPLWYSIRPALGFTFGISGAELRGEAANSDVKAWSRILAYLTLSTQGINFVTAWPFLARSVGILPGLWIATAVYASANFSMKLACRRPRPGNHNSVNGLIWSGVLAVVSTIPAPLAQTQQNFALDLANQYAQTIFEDYVLAPEQNELAAVEADESQGREAKRECTRLMAKIQENKERGRPYDLLFLQAEGKWVPNFQQDKHWEGQLIENLAWCPKSRRLEKELNSRRAGAETALRLAQSDLKSNFGDNYLEAVMQKHPHLFEMYFEKSGRIRSSQRELAEAIRFMFTSNAGVKVMISVPTILSILASLLLFLTTYFYLSTPAVQRSWNSRAALNQRNRIRRTFDGGNGNGQ